MRSRNFIPVDLDVNPEECHSLTIPENGIPIHAARVLLDRCDAVLNGLQVCGEDTTGGFVISHDDVMHMLYTLSGSLGQAREIIVKAIDSRRLINEEVG